MSIASASEPAATVDAVSSVSLYRAIWRWHFFAGLLVIPFLFILSLTGGLYLFRDEIDLTAFAYRNVVEPVGTQMLPSALVEKAGAALPGIAVTAYRVPAGPDRAVRLTADAGEGASYVYLNPYTGAVLDKVLVTQEFNKVVDDLHSLDYFGKPVERIMEIVAGFAIVLVFTGIYLWWPRKQTGGVLSVRGTPARRVFWRDLHAVTGLFSAALIVFMAFSGLLWSGYWGTTVNATLTANGMGYPAELWDNVPKSTQVTSDVLSKSGWLMENAPVPASVTPASVTSGQLASPIGLDKAVAVAVDAGMMPGFEVAIPSSETGVYTAALFPENLDFERTIHIDQYSGAKLVDIAWGQYPALGQAIEWGINVHMGQEWGLFNQLLMLMTSLMVMLSCTAAIVMWWKRRPAGRLGVPPMPPKKSVYAGLWLLAIVFGIAFPLTGLAILGMIAFDQIILRFVPPLARVFS
ncbi:PepSY-associated TM helix domain-containing protein [Pararhizobium sp.]|uniref:PepSY-associated TM helix domain-containing protein n=1 Tax=Pararhizobium sp. TaxID=1977563 RepID=UPI00271A53D5|nr:PepSY domain-containing protein [Pararhizobium sp.]MDO9417215.1 PepSY domain-containing protein [Pararhizobium sp.]